MSRLLWLAGARYLARHPAQTWLSIAGIALGVAVVVAVDLANQSARQAFLLSAETLSGAATHQIVSDSGGIDESFYRTLRVQWGVRDSAPVVEGLLEHQGEPLRLVGVDPLAETAFRPFAGQAGPDAVRRLLVEPGSALLSAGSAARLGVVAGQDLQVLAAGRPVTLHVVGLLTADVEAAVEGVVVTDIATAQEFLHRSGRLDRIDLALDKRQAERLAASLPLGLRLETPAGRTRMLAEMVEAFQTNLFAMSLLALLVGAFLIYNTMTFSVLRRRNLLATMRIVGATRSTLFAQVLSEAALLGLIGTCLGLLLGSAIAHYLVQLVTRTINDLYFVLTVTRLVIEPLVLVKGCAIGLGVTLLAALAPALEAAHSTPAGALRRSLIERRVRTGLPWLALAGAAALLGGWWLVHIPRYGLGGGLTGLFLIICGYSALTPAAVWLMTRLGDRLMRQRGPLTRYALRGIGTDLSRTGLAVTALTVAVAAALGVGVMITSFRATVSDWLNYTLTGDLYLSARSAQVSGADAALPPHTRALIDALPGVVETSSARRVTARSSYGPVQLLALEPATRSHRGFRFTGPPLADLWPRFRRGELVLVSEPYARRHGLQTGAPLLLHTPSGPHTLVVGGVFYDYGSDHGLISLVRSSYARWWQDDSVSTIGVFLDPGTSIASVRTALGSALGDAQTSVQIRSSGEIRAQSLRIFDRTFAVTQVLRVLAVAVAFVGVFSALLALQLERTREQAVLRATGATTGQLAQVTLLQTATMGLYAGLLSLPLGWLMSRVLIEVINRRAFGWSIETRIPAAALPEALLLALTAALLAGIYPALRMRRTCPALALREE